MNGARPQAGLAGLQRRVLVLLDGGSANIPSRFVDWSLILLVVVSVTAMILETEPEIHARWGRVFAWVETIALVVFTLEYVLRLWSAPMHTRYFDLTPMRARLAYAASPPALVDLAAIAPIYASLIGLPDVGALLILRLARFFKLGRYSPGMRSLGAALKAERRALFASAVILIGTMVIAAAAMHVAEQAAQPDKFGSIPQSMWWAIVTLTTVGYGDVVPATLAGKIIAGFTMVAGLMMLALPVGIVATAFAEEIHRREFVVTWGMIARVPLFARLDAAGIAEIMRYLRAQTVPTGAVIVRRGEQAESMFFVADGEVEVEIDTSRHMRLVDGGFFGEVALLRRSTRLATVRALRATKLLVLDSVDLQALMERNPEVGLHLEEALRAHAPADPCADILPEEVADEQR
ncbi:MAG: ion transporter [Methylobacteriaceae bacterium]|nr:ion transporter [Methylobacteriaceae bacterium]